MPMTYTAQPAVAAPPAPKKLRQPGAMRGQIGMADDFDTPDWLIDAMEGKGSELPWPE